MGQRQSSSQQQQQRDNDDTNRRGRVLRPNSRIEVQRNDPLRRPNNNTTETEQSNANRSLNSSTSIPTMAYIPVNENERRDERRRRRELLREQSEDQTSLEAADTASANNSNNDSQPITTTTTATMTTTEGAIISPFSRMIAQVISQAVATSFRNGQIPALNSDGTPQEGQSNVSQQLTMHLSPELFRQMEPESTEDMFIRFIRLPVLVTRLTTPPSVEQSQTQPEDAQSSQPQTQPQEPLRATQESSQATQEQQTTASSEEENEITRIIMLPVFLYGVRSTPPPNTNNDTVQQQETNEQSTPATTATTTATEAANTQQPTRNNNEETREESNQTTNRHWTIYVIGGNHVENIMSDSPSYEELLNLATLIGSVRQPTVSQEEIDNHLTIDKYTAQVKQTIVGNSEKCQVCLNNYQIDEDIRILSCHHGFHKDCIDQWLTQGQNKCPLCRKEAVPRS